MKFICLSILLAAALTASAQTNRTPWCCRYPLRVLGPNAGVNLAPLFQWWIKNGGQNDGQPVPVLDSIETNRPLAAWKRITAMRTPNADELWVLQADIYTNPAVHTNEWIILRNPPAAEEQQYYNLQSEIAQDENQLNDAMRTQASDESKEQTEQARANAEAGDFAKSVRADAPVYGQRAAHYQKAAANAVADQKRIQREHDRAVRELDTLPNEQGQYKIDIFALELGRNEKGVRVFDAGQFYTGTP